MTITFLGNKLDSLVEHELNSNNEYGFTVVVHKSKELVENGYSAKGKLRYFTIPAHVIVYHNVTEVHSRYREGLRPGIAFESDLHATGGTREISSTMSVDIQPSKRMYKSYFGMFIEY
jgi:hypothetical protein